MVDVKSKRFTEDECTTHPIFGYRGQEALYCATHKKENMVDVKNYMCLVDECTVHASYGNVGSVPTRCYNHTETGMIRRPRKRCIYSDCEEIATMGLLLDRKNIFCEQHAHPITYLF